MGFYKFAALIVTLALVVMPLTALRQGDNSVREDDITIRSKAAKKRDLLTKQ